MFSGFRKGFVNIKQRMLCVRFFFLFFISIFSVAASAITIDEFEGDQQASAGYFTNDSSSLLTPLSSSTGRRTSLGGSRELLVQGLTGSSFIKTRIATGLGFLSHSQDAGASGITRVIWDGNQDANVFNPTGLGAIDFTQGGGTALRLDLISFDSPANQAVTLQLLVYGANNQASAASLTLNTNINTLQALEIPFSSFTRYQGATAPVDWQKVGAVMLIVYGYAEDTDLSFEWIGTNSPCRLVPDVNGKAVDDCGVCGGDNSSCRDCLGIPNGNSGPGAACSTGQHGACSAGQYSNLCVCVPVTSSQSEVCDGIDNDCDGAVDENFPQLGDECGVGDAPCNFKGNYTCDSQGGLKCHLPNSEQIIGNCEKSKGCDGVPNSGLEFDLCNVCGGDNSSCMDCYGTPLGSASPDRCGLCEGDGMSCLQCSSNDQTELLRALDGGAKAQERLVKRILREISLSSASAKDWLFVRNISRKAHDLQIRNWTISWWLPRVATVCQNESFCRQHSNQSILEEYRKHSEELRGIAVQAIRRLTRVAPLVSKSKVKKFYDGADSLHARNMALADTVPTFQSVCS